MAQLIIFILVGFVATPCRSESIETTLPPPEEFRIGPSLQLAVPSQLPDFALPIPLYGATISVPLYEHALQPQINYGTGNGVTAFLGEFSGRINFKVPFFSPFLLVGAHFLTYSYANANHNFFGGHFGGGIKIDTDRLLQIQLTMKLLIEKQRILAFGGMLLFRI